MSRFMSRRHAALDAYTPGEQPQDRRYVKLNTNESPFPPSEGVLRAVAEESGRLQLYSDPQCRALHEQAAAVLGVRPGQILMTNGSDEILNFAFMAFGDESHPFACPAVSYGFYPVFAQLNHVPYHPVPLREDLSIDPRDYEGIGMNVLIANPNAPTGLALTAAEIEGIVATNPEHVVVIDEAYVEFGAESCLPLVERYDNLLVTRTFSKSHSMAGARLGYGVGSEGLISDLNTIKYSTNPYNVNRMTMAAGVAALKENDYYLKNCAVIMENRAYTKKKLEELGFTMPDSKANFLFAAHPKLDGEKLYLRLKELGILVRHFGAEEICSYNRITVGTREQMDAFLDAVETVMREEGLR